MASNKPLFLESHVAAQSLKSAWTRLASTYGCIWVALSREVLTVQPHWFARWLIVLLGLDLCHEIPVTQIRGVTETGTWFSYGKVEVRFLAGDGEERRVLLYLKQYREFMNKARRLMS